MPKNTSITLGDHLADFIEEQIAAGRFDSTSEMVRAGLRLLEEQEMKVAALRTALIEGEQSGPASPLDIDTFLADKKRQRTA
jgi:antitoxin ParD1/3/4